MNQINYTRCTNCLCFLCRYEYHWADGTNIKKPIKCSAPKYIDYLMTWVQDQLDDETLFPSKIGEFGSIIVIVHCAPSNFSLMVSFHLQSWQFPFFDFTSTFWDLALLCVLKNSDGICFGILNMETDRQCSPGQEEWNVIDCPNQSLDFSQLDYVSYMLKIRLKQNAPQIHTRSEDDGNLWILDLSQMLTAKNCYRMQKNPWVQLEH